MPETLVILGASARAAAFSALGGGFAPVCGDLFADLDLARVARVSGVADYPEGLVRVARSAPPGWWLYTGGLENRPDLVDCIARERPLAGNGGAVLREVRDPFRLVSVLRAAGLSAPAVCHTAADVPTGGTWLRKPRAGSGGRGISVIGAAGQQGNEGGKYRLPNTPHETVDDAMSFGAPFYQEWIDGEPCSAVYVAAAGRAMLVGVTRQLVGADWCGAGPFHYAGSIGPLTLAEPLVDQFRAVGGCLTEAFGLAGLFGIDAVVQDGRVWTIEVNPRLTASVEILERAGAFSAVAWHLAACRGGELPSTAIAYGAVTHGKAVVYARRELCVTPAFAETAQSALTAGTTPSMADIPAAGTLIRAHHPIATVFAEATDERAVLAALKARAAETYRLLETAA